MFLQPVSQFAAPPSAASGHNVMMKEPVNRPIPLIDFHTGTPRSKSTDTTPIVFLPLTVMAKTSYFALAVRSPGPPAVGARRLRSTHHWVPSPVSAIPKPRIQKLPNIGLRREEPYLLPSAASNGGAPLRRPCGARAPDLAAQGAKDQFGETQAFAARFIEQQLLDVSREPERHRHTAFWQLRSGHEVMCIIVSYTSQD
jgi:hypothetical protein